MKYIMLVDMSVDILGTDKWPKGGQVATGSFWQKLPILFPDEITHSVMFEQLKLVYPGLKLLSAGFCMQSEDGWICEGRSASLGVGSHSTDGDIMDNVIPFKDLNSHD